MPTIFFSTEHELYFNNLVKATQYGDVAGVKRILNKFYLIFSNRKDFDDTESVLWNVNDEQFNLHDIHENLLYKDINNYIVNHLDQEKCSLLHWSAINNRVNLIQLYLRIGAQVDISGGILLSTPLHWAVRQGQLSAVVCLITEGKANPLLADTEGLNSLHLASQFGHSTILLYLLSKVLILTLNQENVRTHNQEKITSINIEESFKIDLNFRDQVFLYMDKPLNQSNNVMLEWSKIIDGNTNQSGLSPLMLACEKCYTSDIFRILINFGSNIYGKNSFSQQTPIHYAVNSTNIAAISNLLSIDPTLTTLKNGHDLTALDLAKQQSQAYIKDILLAADRQTNLVRFNCYIPSILYKPWARIFSISYDPSTRYKLFVIKATKITRNYTMALAPLIFLVVFGAILQSSITLRSKFVLFATLLVSIITSERLFFDKDALVILPLSVFFSTALCLYLTWFTHYVPAVSTASIPYQIVFYIATFLMSRSFLRSWKADPGYVETPTLGQAIKTLLNRHRPKLDSQKIVGSEIGLRLFFERFMTKFSTRYNRLPASQLTSGELVDIIQARLKIMVNYIEMNDNSTLESFGFRRDQYCATCLCLKKVSDRAKHCSLCNRCVAVFDHHCPWIANCVGGKNHRDFLLFLIFLSLCLGLYLYAGFAYWQNCQFCLTGKGKHFNRNHTTKYYSNNYTTTPANISAQISLSHTYIYLNWLLTRDPWVTWFYMHACLHFTWVVALLVCQLHQIGMGVTTNERMASYKHLYRRRFLPTRHNDYEGMSENAVGRSYRSSNRKLEYQEIENYDSVNSSNEEEIEYGSPSIPQNDFSYFSYCVKIRDYVSLKGIATYLDNVKTFFWVTTK